MFTQKRASSAREVSAAHDALVNLIASRDIWFDGTVGSIDNRIAEMRRTLPLVGRVAAVDPQMTSEAQRLTAEIAALHEFKSQRLAAQAPARSMPRVSSAGKLSPRGRAWIAANIRSFLADNADAMDDLDELDTRAEDHAEIATIQMPSTEARSTVAHFRLAANWNARNARRPVAQRRVATIEARDVPDDALFD